MKIVSMRRKSYPVYRMYFIILIVSAAVIAVSAIVVDRTLCLGIECLERYRVATGTFVVPGYTCWSKGEFYFSRRDRFADRVARQYVLTSYMIDGEPRLVISPEAGRIVIVESRGWRIDAPEDGCRVDPTLAIQPASARATPRKPP